MLESIKIVGIPNLPNQTTKVVLFCKEVLIFGKCLNGVFHDSRALRVRTYNNGDWKLEELCLAKHKKITKSREWFFNVSSNKTSAERFNNKQDCSFQIYQIPDGILIQPLNGVKNKE